MNQIRVKRARESGRSPLGVLRCGLTVLLSITASAVAIAEPKAMHRGLHLLLNKAYLRPDFNQKVFDALWQVWPEPLRSKAAQASPATRRELAFKRYGLTRRPGDESGKPMQYVVDKRGNWTMNCFACHGGKVAGKIIFGLPNSHFALATLTEEVGKTKVRMKMKLGRMELGSVFIPLGSTNGTTNAVMFGVSLLALRDANLNVRVRRFPKMVHHDMDAPAWWNYHKKRGLYIDGFAQQGHRALMQFLLITSNGPDKFRRWEKDYAIIESYLKSLRAPKYPFAINKPLAARGKTVFLENCARCHGSYGPKGKYPERVVPIKELGTDPVRLEALTADHRRVYHKSWFAHHGQRSTRLDPKGYVAPPLDGVWASAPYFHNGSVPTLWHVLFPKDRPVVWRRKSADGYNQKLVGLPVEELPDVPKTVQSKSGRREYFDTRKFGKSATGHLFPSVLDHFQRRAVLEYLKTL